MTRGAGLGRQWVGDVVRLHRARRQLAQPTHQVDDSGYLLGSDPKGLPIRLQFGGRSGRHGLLLGASGAGKTTALLLSVARHVERGIGVVVLDMKGDELLARRLHAEAERSLPAASTSRVSVRKSTPPARPTSA